jgi:mannose-6-phosphate isomerase-like protein (cupin superfamily)
MSIKNFLDEPLKPNENCHGGTGVLQHVELFKKDEFKSNLRFINYTILPPGTSIGEHKHGNNEEAYVILEGNGIMSLEDEKYDVKPGSVIINKPYGTHGLLNNGSKDMKVLVFEVAMD